MRSIVLLSLAAAVPAARAIALSAIENLFVFGDSYSASGWDPADGLLNAVGDNGTATGGPVWPQFLAANHLNNASLFDFARNGATVNSSIVTNDADDFITQVARFNHYFSPSPAEAPWTAANSLCAVAFGINDVSLEFASDLKANAAVPNYTTIMSSYRGQIEALYALGMRQFFVMNVPAVDRSPYVVSFGTGAQAMVRQDVELYNEELAALVSTLQASLADADIQLYDWFTSLETILDAPAAFGFSAAVADQSCPAYATLYGQPEASLSECSAPLSEYEWWNPAHLAWGVHVYVAEDVASVLASGRATDMATFGQTALANATDAASAVNATVSIVPVQETAVANATLSLTSTLAGSAFPVVPETTTIVTVVGSATPAPNTNNLVSTSSAVALGSPVVATILALAALLLAA